MKKKRIVICKGCGTEFETVEKNKQYCCDKCRWVQSSTRRREREKDNREREKKETEKFMPKQPKKKKQTGDNLTKCAIEARERGLSYGQYMTQTRYIEETRIRR
jgi:hypothetical protein